MASVDFEKYIDLNNRFVEKTTEFIKRQTKINIDYHQLMTELLDAMKEIQKSHAELEKIIRETVLDVGKIMGIKKDQQANRMVI